jgi:hypothetical protein
MIIVGVVTVILLSWQIQPMVIIDLDQVGYDFLVS